MNAVHSPITAPAGAPAGVPSGSFGSDAPRPSQRTRHPFAVPAAVLTAGLVACVWSLVFVAEPPRLALYVGATAAPFGVLLAVAARVDRRVPVRALVGGAVIGPIVALAAGAAVFAVAYGLISGVADSWTSLFDQFRISPRLVALVSSPIVLMWFAEMVVMAPVTEESGKALGAALAHPRSRTDAFLAGVAAGAGFAMVENVVYATLYLSGKPWGEVAVSRSLGAGIHPLATGLVVLGWWDARHGGHAIGGRARAFFTGGGVHALWNGAIVALMAASLASDRAEHLLDSVGLVMCGLLGVLGVAGLWAVSGALRRGTTVVAAVRREDARSLAAGLVLSAAMLVPVAVLALAFPSFYRG